MNAGISLGSLLTLIAVAGLFSACATNAPQTSATQMAAISQPDWKVGDVCVHEYRFSPPGHTQVFAMEKFGGKVVDTETVTDVAGGRITISDKGDDGSAAEIVMEDGGAHMLKRRAMGDGQQVEFEPASKWLEFPLEPGKTWAEKTAVKGKTFLITDFDASYKALGWEKIKVPAGEFNAIKVVANESYAGHSTTGKGESFQGTGTRTYWMSPETKCIVKGDFRSSFGHWTTVQLLSHKTN
jgi:hypothetical protein